MADVDLLPAAAVGVFEYDREPAKVFDMLLPGDGIHQVAQTLIVDNTGNVFFIGKDNSLWAGNTEFSDKRSSEKFIVCRPHERIVDNVRTLKHRIFEVRTIVRHLMRDTVNKDSIRRRLIHARAAKLSILRDHPLVPLAYLFDKGRRP